MKKIILWCLLAGVLTAQAQAQTDRGLKAGTLAPNFETVNVLGDPVRLADLTAKGPVVLLFYRGGWCWHCNIQLKAFQKQLVNFQKRQTSIVAISVDTLENAAKFVKDKGFDFQVVSHPEADLLKQYDVVFHVPEETARKYKKKYKVDLVAASGRTDYLIAVPAVYVIDQTGTIVFAYANEDYTIRKTPQEILKVLDALGSTNAGPKLHE